MLFQNCYYYVFKNVKAFFLYKSNYVSISLLNCLDTFSTQISQRYTWLNYHQVFYIFGRNLQVEMWRYYIWWRWENCLTNSVHWHGKLRWTRVPCGSCETNSLSALTKRSVVLEIKWKNNSFISSNGNFINKTFHVSYLSTKESTLSIIINNV